MEEYKFFKPVLSWFFFNTEGNEIGKLFWEDGTIKFEGNYEESAKLFFEIYLRNYMDNYIKDQKKRGPYKKGK